MKWRKIDFQKQIGYIIIVYVCIWGGFGIRIRIQYYIMMKKEKCLRCQYDLGCKAFMACVVTIN